MNKDEYQTILRDAESELIALEDEFERLNNKLETKRAEINEAKSTISFVKKKLFSEDEFEESKLNETNIFKPIENKEKSLQQKAWAKIVKWESLTYSADYKNFEEVPIPLWQIAEAFLQTDDKPLHIDEILEKIKRLKHFPKKESLVAVLHQHKKTFVNLGKNKWDLKTRLHETVSE